MYWRDSNTQTLLDAFFRGQPDAEERLARRLRPELIALAREMLGERDADHEDVVHEVLLALFRHLSTRGEFSGELSGYAAVMTRNRCIDILRWRKRFRGEKALESRPGGNFMDCLDAIVAEETAARLAQAMEQLDEESRGFLKEHYLHEKSIRQLTEEQGLGSVQFLYYRRKKALAKLARILKILP